MARPESINPQRRVRHHPAAGPVLAFPEVARSGRFAPGHGIDEKQSADDGNG
jgi:hypothetical protein